MVDAQLMQRLVCPSGIRSMLCTERRFVKAKQAVQKHKRWVVSGLVRCYLRCVRCSWDRLRSYIRVLSHNGIFVAGKGLRVQLEGLSHEFGDARLLCQYVLREGLA